MYYFCFLLSDDRVVEYSLKDFFVGCFEDGISVINSQTHEHIFYPYSEVFSINVYEACN